MNEMVEEGVAARQAVTWQLFRNGPTWDGDIISKAARDDMVERGYVHRANGWSQLTESGLLLALSMQMHDRKEAEASRSRSTEPKPRAYLIGVWSSRGPGRVVITTAHLPRDNRGIEQIELQLVQLLQVQPVTIMSVSDLGELTEEQAAEHARNLALQAKVAAENREPGHG